MMLLFSVFKLVALKVWGDRESLCKFITAENPYLGKTRCQNILCIQFREQRVCVFIRKLRPQQEGFARIMQYSSSGAGTRAQLPQFAA